MQVDYETFPYIVVLAWRCHGHGANGRLYLSSSKNEVEGSDEKHHLHTSHVGVQWLLAAGIGPVLVTSPHHLTPLFTLTDGTKAYPSSFTVGIDVFYFISRFTGHRE